MKILTAGEIRQTVSMAEMIEAIRDAFCLQQSGDYQMPPRAHLDYPNGTLLLMPCSKRDVFATKLVSVFPRNAEHNEPVTIGQVILNDAKTGKPLAFLDGTALTALRTGAVGAIGASLLSPSDASQAALIGCGNQGLHQILALSQVRPLSRLRFFDQSSKRMSALAEALKQQLPDLTLLAAPSAAAALADSQIVVCTTTSQQPVLPNEPQLLKGKTYIGIGAFKPDMRELPDALWPLAKGVFVDTDHAVDESGELAQPIAKGLLARQDIRLLADIINNQPQSPSPEGALIFKSVGMSLFDLQAAQLIYQKSLEKNSGIDITL